MDVQKDNFSQAVEIFEHSLNQSELVALDLEFTGIRGKPETYIDSTEERYSSLRRIASTFRIIQVGLCCFTRKQDHWEAQPFNFYVFPSEVPGQNQRLVLEIGAINFLKEHRMDFNTWFYRGIPYLNEAQSKELELKLNVQESDNEDIVLTKTHEQVKMSEVIHRIEKWLTSTEGSMEVSGLNAYLRKYLYSYAKKKFKGLFISSNKIEGSRDVNIVLKKGSELEISELEAKRKTEKNEQFNEKLGFRRIFNMLTESKKPLIVHNGLMDLLFIISAFQEDLPEKYLDFKALANRLFPSIFDTRFLLEKIPGFYEEFDKVVSAKGLKELYRFLKSNTPEVRLAEGFQKYNEELFAHEAGFDALMTGICFLKLHNMYPNIESYRNHLPLYKCYFAVRLDGDDPFYPDSSYYLKGHDLKQYFAGSEGFVYRYAKDDEGFVKALSAEKQSELDSVISSKNLYCLSLENYFSKKKQSDDNS